MSSRTKIGLVKYVCCAVFTALIAWAYLSSKDLGNAILQDRYRFLCDAFTIPGMLMILSGALLWVSNEGAFYGVSYCLRVAIFALIPGKHKDASEKYGDYVERKKQKKVHGYAFLFWSGLLSMAVALVFFILYSMQ